MTKQDLQIQLLGKFGVLYRGELVDAVNVSRLQSLIAYLVLHVDDPPSRTHLASLFWPDSSESQAHTNLRNLLHRLRRALPEADLFLESSARTIRWRPDSPSVVDVNTFLKACHENSLEEALELYRGDLLPDCYDSWVAPLREHLRHSFFGAIERLLDLMEEKGEYKDAISCAYRRLEHDELHEETYFRLMRLHALQEDRAAALRTYERLVAMLDRELGVSPSSRATVFYERLKKGLPDAKGPVKPETPFVGRIQEWNTLKKAWGIAEGGKPLVVAITGEAGIGKTRLAEELALWVDRQGHATARTLAYREHGALAYAPIVSLLRNKIFRDTLRGLDDLFLVELTRLLPEIRVDKPGLQTPAPMGEAWQRLRFLEALARGILSVQEPLLVRIDDLQWLDPETIECLHYLMSFDSKAPLLIVGTVRPEGKDFGGRLGDLRTALRHSGQWNEIELGPLDRDQTAILAAELHSEDLPADSAERLYRETEGNPLFIVEIVRAGRIGSALPPTIRAVVEERLQDLSPSAQAVVRLAAVIGRAFEYDVLRELQTAPKSDLENALDELCVKSILREQDEATFEFGHDKIREVAYESIRKSQRRGLHRAVAETLERFYATDPDRVSSQLALHFERAGMNDRAAHWYVRASDRAESVHANDEAVAHLQHALTLAEDTSPLYEHLGDLQVLLGREEAAIRSYEKARAGALASLDEARLKGRIARAHTSQHKYDRALGTYESALECLGEEPEEPTDAWWSEWIQLKLGQVWVHYWLGDWAEIAARVEETRPAVQEHASALQRANFYQALMSMSLLRERFVAQEETLTYARAQLEAAEQTNDAQRIAVARFMYAFTLLWAGSLPEAETWAKEALASSEKTGDLSLRSRCLTYLTILYRKRGQVERVKLFTNRSLAAAETAHMPEYVGTAIANQAWLAWCDGDLDKVMERGAAAISKWQELPETHPSCAFRWTALWPLIGTTLEQKRPEQAIDYARDLLDPSQQRLHDPLPDRLHHAVEAWEQGDSETAAGELKRIVELAQEMDYL